MFPSLASEIIIRDKLTLSNFQEYEISLLLINQFDITNYQIKFLASVKYPFVQNFESKFCFQKKGCLNSSFMEIVSQQNNQIHYYYICTYYDRNALYWFRTLK